MTSIELMVDKMRRAIGDVDKPYAYEDTALIEYLEDAVDKVALEWNHPYSVDRVNHSISPEVPNPIQILFVMRAKLDMLERQPDISFRSGSLGITRKSDDRKALTKKIDEIINNLIANEAIGVNYTELDHYANRLEHWLYMATL